ncbi:type 4a pilus biogenesis protein PilO [Neisseriaceae bacterium TC5R-5]|nr:type 4a pilus biogenesis protein PilO [Neisseriaceae bacterium TC5R-5]
MTLDELRSLDPKDLPNWPFHAQLLFIAVIALLLLGLGYFFVLSSALDDLATSKQQEEQLKQTFIDKKRQAVNLNALEQQLQDIRQSFGTLLKQLPTKSDMDTLLNEINQAGVGHNLQFELFKPNPEIKSAEMAELPISIRLSGSYNDIAAFISDIAQLSRIVTITDMSLVNSNNRLTLDATAKTFRALEPEERAAQATAPKK